MTPIYAALIGQLNQDLTELDRLVAEIQALANQLENMHHQLRQDLDQFCNVLRSLSE